MLCEDLKVADNLNLHTCELRDALKNDWMSEMHCVKSVRTRSCSVPRFSRIFLHSDLSVFSLNAGKCGKNVDQNNSKYGHFLRSDEGWVMKSNRENIKTQRWLFSRSAMLIDVGPRQKKGVTLKVSLKVLVKKNWLLILVFFL